MLNQIVVVGRITRLGNFDKARDEFGIINIAVPRAFKNVNGKYETDFIDIEVPKNIMESCIEFCRTGDLVGVKGRIENLFQDNERHLKVVAEKVTFLSSNNRRVEE